MAYPIHGKVARFEKNSVEMSYTTGWTINVNLELDEITAQGDDWKTHVAGISDWSGSVDCIFDPSNTEQLALMNNIVAATPGTKLTDCEFNLEDSGDYFSGNLFVVGFPVTANISGKVTCSFNFMGDGALSLTIA